MVCDLTRERTHGRRVGWCYLDGQDVAEALVRAGLARDCPRYSGGRYAAVEPASAREPPSVRIIRPMLPAGRQARSVCGQKPVQKLDRFSQVVAGGVVGGAGPRPGWPRSRLALAAAAGAEGETRALCDALPDLASRLDRAEAVLALPLVAAIITWLTGTLG